MTHRIAFFISPHGFGHAARSCSIIEHLHNVDSEIGISIFTTVPKWFFENSLGSAFDYHAIETDIGLVQKNPLEEDLPKTLEKLNNLYPLTETNLAAPKKVLQEKPCDLIISDIAPMGIEIARQLGIPSLLVENFTWDWIYKGYTDHLSQLSPHIDYLSDLPKSSTYRLIAEPYCFKPQADLITKPISRAPRNSPDVIRDKLGIGQKEYLVLLTMGGIEEDYKTIQPLKEATGFTFLIPGGKDQVERDENILFLPLASEFYHPDLIYASDIVISKIGYSTLAEIYQAGKPFGYIPREGFRESELLEGFIINHMNGCKIDGQSYQNGSWVRSLETLKQLPLIERESPTGAEQAAEFILSILSNPVSNGRLVLGN